MNALVPAALSFLKLAVLTVILAELLGRTGAPVRDLWRFRQDEPGLSGSRFILGYLVTGAVFFGLALTGLFRPAVLAVMGLLPAAAGLAAGNRPILPRMLAGWRGLAAPESILALGLGLPLLAAWTAPVAEIDAFIYHLAVPAQYLAAGRAVFADAGVNFLLPLPYEMMNAIPLIVGDERLAQWMNGLIFLSAAACFSRHRMKAAVWIGLAFAAACARTGFLLGRVKGDVAAASLLLAGAGIAIRGPGSASMSGLLLGAAAATKGTCLPLAAALGLLSRGTRRHAGPACAGAILPLLPWALKSWLILGNPLFPLLYSVIPTFRFSELNLPLQAAFFQPWTDPRARSILSLPASTFSFFLSEHVALPLAAAGCLAFGRNRAAVLAALAGGAAILYATHIPRFAVPAAVLMAFLAGRDVTGFGLMPASAWRVAASAAVAAGFFIHPFPAGLARAGSSLEEGRRRELLDLLEVSRFTARALPGRPVLLAGDARSFPFSQRVISAGALYETPLVWRLLRETPDAARLRVRFRQLGTDMIVYNFVGALGGAGRAWPGGWENGDLVRYRDFAARFLEIARPPARIDRAGGGFYVFRILNRPRERAAGLVYHLPGIEAIFAEGDEELRLHDRPAEAIKRYRSLARILPNTGVIAEKIAYASYLMGEHRQALEALDPYVAAGWVGELSLVIHGASALELGMRDKARASLERAIALYPEHRQALEASLARLASAPKE